MKRASLLVSMFVSFFGGSVFAAGPTLEALKSNDLLAGWGAVHLEPVAPKTVESVPVTPPAAQFAEGFYPGGPNQDRRIFGKNGYTFESEAQNARAAAEANLRSAGVVVLVSNVVRDNGYPYKYSFRIEYLERGPYSRPVEAYTSGANFNFDSEARYEMNRTVDNYRSAGYQVVLGEVRRQNDYPYRYFYQVDYIRTGGGGRPGPGYPEREYRSGHYRDWYSAQNDMNGFVARFRAEGKVIVRSDIIQDRGWYSFRIVYREPRRW